MRKIDDIGDVIFIDEIKLVDRELGQTKILAYAEKKVIGACTSHVIDYFSNSNLTIGGSMYIDGMQSDSPQMTKVFLELLEKIAKKYGCLDIKTAEELGKQKPYTESGFLVTDTNGRDFAKPMLYLQKELRSCEKCLQEFCSPRCPFEIIERERARVASPKQPRLRTPGSHIGFDLL